MRTITKNASIFSLLALFLFIGLGACTSKYAFQTSTAVPAARGDVKVKKDGNNNYLIKVDIANLAEVKRLQPPREAYVIWMEIEDNVIKNIGQIKSGSSMISSKLKASFQTVTSSKPKRVFITAEDDAAATQPGSMVILTTDRF